MLTAIVVSLIVGFLSGAGALCVLAHKLTDGRVWGMVFGGSSVGSSDASTEQGLQAVADFEADSAALVERQRKDAGVVRDDLL